LSSCIWWSFIIWKVKNRTVNILVPHTGSWCYLTSVEVSTSRIWVALYIKCGAHYCPCSSHLSDYVDQIKWRGMCVSNLPVDSAFLHLTEDGKVKEKDLTHEAWENIMKGEGWFMLQDLRLSWHWTFILWPCGLQHRVLW
jgi:hypothetical protein